MIDDAAMDRLFHSADERPERGLRQIGELLPAVLAKYQPPAEQSAVRELEFSSAHLTACVLM